MGICERCGNELPEEVTICPRCGTHIDIARVKAKFSSPPTNYGQYRQQQMGDVPQYEHGYTGYYGQPPADQQSRYGYAPPSHGYTFAQTHYARPFQAPYRSTSDVNSPLIVEVILSLLGIFGVGWLMGGETTIGIVLLLCSIFLYWPFFIGVTVFTFGFGLICLGPLAIITIIINALLLQRKLLRKTAHVVFVPSPPQSMPPRPQ